MVEATRILLVDDNDAFAKHFSRRLARYGSVRVAGTKGAALKALADGESWRAIIVDNLLPDGLGLDVIAEAKRNHPDTPMLLITGNPDLCCANKPYAMAVDYLEKPIDVACLERFMQSRAPLSEKIDRRACIWSDRYLLTEAETDVLRRAAHGESRDAIASARGSSTATVKRQIWTLLQKTADESLHAAVDRLVREAAA